MLEQSLGTSASSTFELPEPLLPVGRSIDRLPLALDGATAKQGFDPLHHPGRVFDQVVVAPDQFLQIEYCGRAMEHATQVACAQSLRELLHIDPVILVPGLPLATQVAHDHSLGVRLDQVVQPLRLGAFLEGDVDPWSGSLHHAQNRCRLGRHGSPHHNRSRGVA